jgi:hypothetical protein
MEALLGEKDYFIFIRQLLQLRPPMKNGTIIHSLQPVYRFYRNTIQTFCRITVSFSHVTSFFLMIIVLKRIIET